MARSAPRERDNRLGAYRRARRDRVTPAQVGIVVSDRRRVPGLRREEVAMLAGISADYYLRLERGKDRTPSPQVLDALARALRLDADHVAHLRALAAEPPAVGTSSSDDVLPQTALDLIEALDQPAFLEDAGLTVLAANAAARDLNPRLRPGRNQLRDLYLDPQERAMHPDWEGVAACMTAGLRYAMGAGDDARLHALAAELSGASATFRRIWARHDVRAQRGAVVRLTHAERGEQVFTREQLRLNGTDGLALVIYSPRASSVGTSAVIRQTGGEPSAPVRVVVRNP
ncbi:helix-turn-helix transcriptional regulator [Microbacterium sp.]|uniref:helix-turn-helix domain-containing protein n=1 Tax=Microbacterium sp. TaxID=51671 RepID=UPI00289734AB|nr:helix-turn-helix transcriptional regulator [Microbacterium sp.]